MAELNAAPLLAGAVSLERQYLALALQAVAAAARGHVEIAEQALETLAERAVLLSTPALRTSFLRLVHWR